MAGCRWAVAGCRWGVCSAHCSAIGVLKSAAAVALLSGFLNGCSTPKRQTVTALPRVSYSDENSRALAAQSLSLLKERSTDYRIGAEDILEISIFEWEQRGETRTLDVRVTETGSIALPVVGDLKVEGLTAEQIKQLLERHLREGGILNIPRVSVLIKEFRSKRVAVVGAVQEPGVYTLRQNVGTLLELLTLAGGITDRAGQVLYVIHGGAQPSPAQDAALFQRQVIAIDLYELLEEGSQELNVVVQNGDMINVPLAKDISVLGFVKRPGRFPLTRRTNVMEAIALAEGLREREASVTDCVLKRQTVEGTVFIPLDLEAISDGASPNLQLLPNDVVEVRQSPTRHAVLEFLDLFKGLFTFGYTLNRP